MEPESSLPCTQEPATGPYPEPDEASPHVQSVSLRCIQILSSHLCLCLSSGLFPSGLAIKSFFTYLTWELAEHFK
jgi:hypothetical protein